MVMREKAIQRDGELAPQSKGDGMEGERERPKKGLESHCGNGGCEFFK